MCGDIYPKVVANGDYCAKLREVEETFASEFLWIGEMSLYSGSEGGQRRMTNGFKWRLFRLGMVLGYLCVNATLSEHAEDIPGDGTDAHLSRTPRIGLASSR
jgi:hypothetical protein